MTDEDALRGKSWQEGVAFVLDKLGLDEFAFWSGDITDENVRVIEAGRYHDE